MKSYTEVDLSKKCMYLFNKKPSVFLVKGWQTSSAALLWRHKFILRVTNEPQSYGHAENVYCAGVFGERYVHCDSRLPILYVKDPITLPLPSVDFIKKFDYVILEGRGIGIWQRRFDDVTLLSTRDEPMEFWT